MSESEAALARAVLIHGPLSRRELTTRLGLSPASLTRLAKPLLDSGLIVELDDVADGSIGRPSKPLDIARDVGAFIGIKLTGDQLFAVRTDIRAEPLGWAEVPLPDRAPASVIAQIVAVVDELGRAGTVGVGVSLGGNVQGGTVQRAPFLEWGAVNLAALLESELGLPVAVENDVVALAEAERWFGAGKGLAGFVTITIGAGVGYGVVVDGRVVRTADATIGTGGHLPLDPYGPLCLDGHRGCSQAMLTAGSITAQVSAALGRVVDYDQTLALAASGDPAARAVVDSAGDALGRLIAMAANLSLQHSVVLAGEGIALYPLVADRVAAAIRSGREGDASPIDIHVDETGFRGWARGAAAVAIQAAMARMHAAR